MKNALLKSTILGIALIFFCSVGATAQAWLNGYNFRKKITIDKSKVTPITVPAPQDLVDFPVLIEFSDVDLIYIEGSCSNKIQNSEGKDISFTLSNSPAIPLNFQLESYKPREGKITCWVKIPSLAAKGTPSLATSIYLYYGSAITHEPYDTKNLNTWSASYARVWHLNKDLNSFESLNAQSAIAEQNAVLNHQTNRDNLASGKLSNAILLNGNSEFLSSSDEQSTEVTLSAWVKTNSLGTEQVILTNEAVKSGAKDGYTLMIGSTGHLKMHIYKNAVAAYTVESSAVLQPDVWYFVTGVSSISTYAIFMNGVAVQSKSLPSPKLGTGGGIRIGASKNDDRYFNGVIDEVRIQKTVRPTAWLITEYTNQNNPSEFISIGQEEYYSAGFARFTGSVNNVWTNPLNWSTGTVPENGSNVIISAGKSTGIPSNENAIFNTLVLEAGAGLILNGSLKIECTTRIASGASLSLGNDAKLSFGADIINNGSVYSSETTGTIEFVGQKQTQQLVGNGTIKIFRLENRQLVKDFTMSFESPVQITGYLKLVKGGIKM